jgi:hypothetical protein
MFALLLLACTEPKDSGNLGETGEPVDTDTGAEPVDTDDTGDTADTGDTGTSGLPDARDRMVRSGEDCEDIAGHDDVPAARLWYWGELSGDAETGFTGVEAWYFFGNTSWYARGLEDCEVHFDLSDIEVTGAGACSTCDYGVKVEAEVNLDLTTCPPSLYAGYETMTEAYAIELLGDGSASWYFPGSGNALGDGYWDSTGVNYLADDGCSLPVD